MPDRDVQINVTAAGAAAAAADLQKVAAAEEQVAAAETKVAAAAAPAAAATEQLAAAEEKAAQSATVHKEATEKGNTASENASGTVRKLKQSKEELATTTGNSGQKLMIWGQAIQDAQYGVGALANQAGQLAQSLGFGAGVGGVALIAATGITLLTKHVDLFGEAAAKAKEEAKQLADKHQDLAVAASKAADEARREADNSALASEHLKAHKEAIEGIVETYDKWSKAIEKAIALREKQRQQDLAESDAAAGLAMAQIDRAEKEGKLTPQQAEEARNKVTAEAEDRKFESGQQGKIDKENAARAEAENARSKAESIAAEAAKLGDKGRSSFVGGDRGLLDEKPRAALQEENKKALADITSLREKMEAARLEQHGAENQEKNLKESGREYAPEQANEARRQADEARQRADELEARMAQAQVTERDTYEALRGDQAAANRSGKSNRKDLNEAVEKQLEKAAEERKKANEFEDSADESEAGRKSDRSVYDINRTARDIRSGNRVMDFDKRDAEKSAQEAERAAREKEKEERERARFRSKFDKESGQLQGAADKLPPEIQQALNEAIRKNPDGGGDLSATLRKLADYLKKKNLEDSKVAKELADLRALISEQRDGH